MNQTEVSKRLSAFVTISFAPFMALFSNVLFNCNTTLHFNGHFSRWIWVSRHQNVSILDFTGAKDEGCDDDNWSYKACKAPVQSSPSTNQHPAFLQAGRASCCPTNSVGALSITFHGLDHPKLTCGSSSFVFDHSKAPVTLGMVVSLQPSDATIPYCVSVMMHIGYH